MKAIKFVKDGQSAWANADNTVHSAAVETTNESLDLETGFTREEKNIMWIKGNSPELVAKQVDNVVKQINAGKLATYRAFSATPTYEGQSADINPQTEQELVPARYSQIKLCVADKYLDLNRSYFVPAVVAEAPAINAEA